MKKTLIALAVSQCVTASWALAPSAYTPGAADTVELFLAGATAEKNLIPHILGGAAGTFSRYGSTFPATTGICRSAAEGGVDLDIYYDSKGAPRAGYDYRVYSCTLGPASRLGASYSQIAGKKIWIHYRQKLGSWFGTGPVARNLPVDRLAISATTCFTGVAAGAVTGTNNVATTTISAFPIVTGSSPAAYDKPSYVCKTEKSDGTQFTIADGFDPLVHTQSPDLGIADNEPAIFVGANAPFDGVSPGAYYDAITPTDLQALAPSKPVFAFPLAIAATRKLVDALATNQQKVLGTLSATDTYTANGLVNPLYPPVPAASNYDDARRPSISFTQISALLTSNGGFYNYNWAGLLAGDTHQVNICRRISAVATQITSNAFFGNYPCAATGVAPSVPADSIAYDGVGGGYRVIENDLIPDERNCLKAFNNATATDSTYSRGVDDTGTPILETINSATDGNYAIGPLFIDNNPTKDAVSNANTWDFLKIDGIDPTVPNVVAGKYRYINTAVINRRAGSDVTLTTNPKGQLTDLLIKYLQKPEVLAVQTGFVALQESGYTGYNNILKGSNSAKTCQPIIQSQ